MTISSQVHNAQLASHAAPDHAFLKQIIETQNDIAALEFDPAALMKMIVQRTRTLTHADGAVLEFLDGDQMVYRAGSGTLAHAVGTRLPVQGSLVGQCVTTGKLVYCADTETDPRVHLSTCRELNIRSMIVVPLTHQSKIVGVLKVSSANSNAFNEQAIDGLQLMAGLLGAALTHAAEFENKKTIIAERTAALARLRDSEERFRQAFDHAAIGKALVALDGRFGQVNPALCRILGYSEEELLATNFQSLTHPDDLKADLDHVNSLVKGRIPHYHMTKRYLHKQGHVVHAQLTVTLVRDSARNPLYFVSQVQDITEQKRSEWLESDRRKILELVVKDLPLNQVLDQLTETIQRQIPDVFAGVMLLQNGILALQAKDLPHEWNSALRTASISLAARLSAHAWESPDRLGITFLNTNSLWSDLKHLAAQSNLAACWAIPIQSTDESPLGLLTVFCRQSRRPTKTEAATLDMAVNLATICIEHHLTTQKLAHLIRHDPLTGLPNRVLFEDRLNHALALAQRSRRSVALLMLDIDRFKEINDTLGHHAGDLILQQFSARLLSHLRQSDTMARLGGDEFVIILPETASPDEPRAVAAKLIDSLKEPFHLTGHAPLIVTTSIGIALAPTDGDDSTTLQKNADAALYRAKAQGRNRFAR